MLQEKEKENITKGKQKKIIFYLHQQLCFLEDLLMIAAMMWRE